MNRPTLHDVAREAGVSHTTVARVLNHPGQVRAATRERVAAALERTGYRPDPVLSALAAYRHQRGGPPGSRLAFIDCDGTPFSREVCAGAQAEAALLGYGVDRFLLSQHPGTGLGRMLYHRGVRGLLFGPSEREEELSRRWRWEHFAAVSLGALTHRPPLHSVAMNYFEAARTGALALRWAGCRRVVLAVEASLEQRTGHAWLGGCAAGLDGRAPVVLRGPWGPSLLEKLRWRRSDGVLTIHSEVARLLAGRVRVRFLNQFGALPELPYYALEAGVIGQEGVRLLHHALLRQEYGLPKRPRRMFLDGAWHEPE